MCDYTRVTERQQAGWFPCKESYFSSKCLCKSVCGNSTAHTTISYMQQWNIETETHAGVQKTVSFKICSIFSQLILFFFTGESERLHFYSFIYFLESFLRLKSVIEERRGQEGTTLQLKPACPRSLSTLSFWIFSFRHLIIYILIVHS